MFLQTHSRSTHTEVPYVITRIRGLQRYEKEPRTVTGSPFCNLMSGFLITVIYSIWLKNQRVQRAPFSCSQKAIIFNHFIRGFLAVTLTFLNNSLLPLFLPLSPIVIQEIHLLGYDALVNLHFS